MSIEFKIFFIEKYCNAASDKMFADYLRYGSPVNVPYHAIKSIIEEEHYIWRTREDAKVRPEHAANNGKIFEWDKRPPTGYPGEAINCRRWAEAVMATTDDWFIESLIRMDDITTWLAPPINGKLTEGSASKLKYHKRGEKSLYDQYGGEWRPDLQDGRHNLHWDYKPAGRCSKWLNIRINNIPTLKRGYQYVENKVFSEFQRRNFCGSQWCG